MNAATWVPDDGVPARCLRCGAEQLPHRPGWITALWVAVFCLGLPYAVGVWMSALLALFHDAAAMAPWWLMCWRAFCVVMIVDVARDCYRWVDRLDARKLRCPRKEGS